MTLMRTLILLLALSFAISPVAKAQPIERPEWVWTFAGVKFWFVKNMVLDVDDLLNKKGFKAQACVYRSAITKQDTPYKGLGPCLYLNFMESMTTDQISGITYFWLEGSNPDTPPIEINWRPPQDGLVKFIQQSLEMKFEGPLYWLRSHFSNSQNAEAIHYREFLGGEIKLILPDDPGTMKKLEEVIFRKNSPQYDECLQKYALTCEDKTNDSTKLNLQRWDPKNIRQLDLDLKPIERKNGLVVHTGIIRAELGKTNQNESESITVAIQTNFNILVRDRKSSLKIKTTAIGEGFGSIPGATHAP